MASTKVIHDALARYMSTALFYKNAYVIVCNCIIYIKYFCKYILQFDMPFINLSIPRNPPKPQIEKIDDDCVRAPCVQPSLKSRPANIPKLEEGS